MIIYDRNNNTSASVIGYVDSEFTGDLDRIRSLIVYVFTFATCAISWKATLQSKAVLSATEAKYMAATEAVNEAIWLTGLVGDLGLEHKLVTVFYDSQSAIDLTHNPKYHKKIKHIDVRAHFI